MTLLLDSRPGSTLASLLLGFAAISSAVAADLYVPVGYPTIQAAVDAAASNDTIHIAPGVYAGQILISNKSLTLSGSPGTVLRATAEMSQPYTPMGFTVVPLLGILKSDVVVSNLAFEGEHLANAYPDPQYLQAIFYFGSGGRVEDCRITGFRGPTLGEGFARAVQVSNPAFLGTDPVTIHILRNTLADNLISITLIGDSKSFTHATFDPALLRTTFVVSENTITGNGPDATGVQSGIHILAGATGEVSRNTISDHAYIGATDPSPWAFGILALDDMNFEEARLQPLKPIRFLQNVLRSNQWHMLVLRGDGSAIANNSFDGTAPGSRPTGLGLSGENLSVDHNRFSNLPQGILLFGNDPDFGEVLGLAHDGRLTANRFCNVANEVILQPLATATQEGTLPCSAAPVLTIASAVLLSWPGDEAGWTVESALTPDGPWTPVPASHFLQAGQHSVAVPTGTTQSFFRLRQP